MCFYIQKGKEQVKKAKRDITVYKVFYKDHISNDKKSIQSLHQSFVYEFGQCYHEDRIDKYKDSINAGLHSYSVKRKAKYICYNSWTGKKIILPCIIPEGANYYYNSNSKEYVSDYIIIGKYKDILESKDVK
jgi:hypothetical protein